MIVAIDGSAASGKGTLAKELAQHLGYDYLDTGALYRAVALSLLNDGMNENNISGIKNILDSIVTGIDSGSVSVKDTSKSKDSIAEIKNLIPSLISTKEKFETKKHGLLEKLENFDSKSLQTVENNLKHDESDVSDALSKLKVFEDENLDLTNSLPTILHQIETNLKDVTSTSYTISTDNQ